MTINRDLLQTIIADPDDDVPRLVYADWLEEQGDPARAEFIRAQSEAYRLFRSGRDLEQAFRLRRRQFDLLRQHETAWVRPLQSFVQSWTFERGFVTYVAMTGKDFLTHGTEVFRDEPITRIYLMNLVGLLGAACASPLMGRLSTVIVQAGLRAELDILATAPGLDHLARLDVGGDRLDQHVRQRLVRRFGSRLQF